MCSMAARIVASDVSKALVSRYIDVATTSLVFYDWSTGLADEIEFVWKAPSSSLPKYIFVVLRYVTLSAQLISLLFDFLLTVSAQACKNYARTIVALTYIVLACTELIIMLRLFTTHRGNKLLYRAVWVLYISSVIASAVIVALWAHHLTMTVVLFVRPGFEPQNILPGCWSPQGGKFLFIPFGFVVVWEIAVSLATFWKTWRTYVTTGTPFWLLFYKHGNHFYACVLVFSLIGVGLVVMFEENGSDLFQGRIIFTLIRTVHSICVARLLLHVRRQGRTKDEDSSQSNTRSFQLTRTNSKFNDAEGSTTPSINGKRLETRWKGKVGDLGKNAVILEKKGDSKDLTTHEWIHRMNASMAS